MRSRPIIRGYEIYRLSDNKVMHLALTHRNAEIAVRTFFKWCEVSIRPVYASTASSEPKIQWFFGLPGAGKTTAANKAAAQYSPSLVLDGDVVRDAGEDYDFSTDGRTRQARRLAKLAKTFAGYGIHVFVAACTPGIAMREKADKYCPGIEWVHIDTPRDLCVTRRPRLYAEHGDTIPNTELPGKETPVIKDPMPCIGVEHLMALIKRYVMQPNTHQIRKALLDDIEEALEWFKQQEPQLLDWNSSDE